MSPQAVPGTKSLASILEPRHILNTVLPPRQCVAPCIRNWIHKRVARLAGPLVAALVGFLCSGHISPRLGVAASTPISLST